MSYQYPYSNVEEQGKRSVWNKGKVISPNLQKELDSVLGYKGSRTVTLHGIGSALYFKSMFPINDSNKEIAEYVALMAGEEGKSIDMERTRTEIQSLHDSLGEYRQVVERLLSDQEIMSLSKQARQETKFKDVR